jgi:hypothetical protein
VSTGAQPPLGCELGAERQAAGASFLKLSVTPQGQAAALVVQRFA